MPILGLTQNQLLPGSWHWVIQLVHLLVGLGAMGQGEGLARRIKAARTLIAVQSLVVSERDRGLVLRGRFGTRTGGTGPFVLCCLF